MENVSWVDILKILIVPATLISILIILMPLIKRMVSSMAEVRFGGIELSIPSEGDTAPATPGDERPSARPVPPWRSARTLAEEPKEKLEKLRMALESQQVTQLIQYHANGLAQSKISFWFSIGAGTLGFLVIVLGTLLAFTTGNLSSSLLTVASGGIIDAVAALFFTQSNQARKLMTEFFDKLRADRQFHESLRLCDSISDQTIQSELKARLSLFFAGVPSSAVFGTPSGHRTRQEPRKGTEPKSGTPAKDDKDLLA